MRQGDLVVYPSKQDRDINIGQITGEYSHTKKSGVYQNRRRVKWLKKAVPRPQFSQGALSELGSNLCLFQIKNHADEFLAILEGNRPKANATGQIPAQIAEKNPDLSFTPEFQGPKKGYTLTAAIESQCDHGRVVNTLHTELKVLGFDAYRTARIDLFLADGENNITHLIEVKTDQTTTNLYEAVGQVMMHGALEKSCWPQRILVLPGGVTTGTPQPTG